MVLQSFIINFELYSLKNFFFFFPSMAQNTDYIVVIEMGRAGIFKWFNYVQFEMENI